MLSYADAMQKYAVRYAVRMEMFIRRSVVPIQWKTNIPGHETSWSGTGFLVRFEQRHFCILTRHQIGKQVDPVAFNAQPLSLRIGRDDTMLTSSRITWRTDTADETNDACDVVVLELPWKQKELSDDVFFCDWSPADSSPRADEGVFVVGYSHALFHPDYDESGVLVSAVTKQVLLDVVEFNPKSASLSHVRVSGPKGLMDQLAGDFDGLSGSPVLGFDASLGQFRFHGMVLRGGNMSLYVMPAAWMTSVLQEACRPLTQPLVG